MGPTLCYARQGKAISGWSEMVIFGQFLETCWRQEVLLAGLTTYITITCVVEAAGIEPIQTINPNTLMVHVLQRNGLRTKRFPSL